jgi:hypothetical protein
LNDPSAVPFNPDLIFTESSFSPAIARRVLQQLTYRSADVGPEPLEAPGTYWSFFDLADRPLVPCGEGLLAPCSLRHGLERPTTGIFWMLHHDLAGSVGHLTAHFGRMFEHYCLQLTKGIEESESVRVSGELEYGRKSARRRTADVLVSTAELSHPPTRIIIECRAGRPPASVFSRASRSAFTQYIADLVGKLRQLDRVIRDHQAGAFALPGDLAGRNDAYIPLLIVDRPFQWSVALRNVLDKEVRRHGYFRDPRVSPPIVCSVKEFEHLVRACEEGVALSELLRDYLASDRADPLEVTIHDRVGRLRVPAYTRQGWDAFAQLVTSELFT